jgi:hypothetical protein
VNGRMMVLPGNSKNVLRIWGGYWEHEWCSGPQKPTAGSDLNGRGLADLCLFEYGGCFCPASLRWESLADTRRYVFNKTHSRESSGMPG